MAKSSEETLQIEIIRIVAVYSLFGGLWIYLSDSFLGMIIHDPAVISRISIYKGLVFIALTATLLYVLISRYSKRISANIAKLNQSQLMLAQQKTLLNAVVEGTTDAVYIKDGAGRYLLANSAVAAFIKRPITDIIGQDDTHLFPRDEALVLMAKDQWVMAQSAPQMYEEQLTTPDGIRTFLSTKGPVFDADGVVTGLFGVARDITDWKRSDEALRESEARFRTLMENIPSVAVQGYTLDGTVVFWNRASELLYGYSAAEASGANLLDLIIPPEMHAGVTGAMQQMIETGEPIPAGELVLTRKNGSRVPVFSSHALVNPIGRKTELFCLDIDLTERKRAEEALIESEHRWKFAIEGSGDGVWDWNIATDEAKYSKRWKEMLGYSEEDILPVNQEWVDRIHPEDRNAVAGRMRAYLEGKTDIYVVEYRLRCKNESYKWILGRGMIVSRSEDNAPMRMVGTHTDITDRINIEKEHLKIAKFESLSLLAGGIAHDFNNILTGIMGNISFALLFLDATHKSHNPLTEAEKASVRATQLARQLLTFARGGEPVKKVMSLPHLVHETVSLVLHGSNVKATIEIPDSIYAVEADEGQMSQLFHNIIINATQAMPGGGTLNISAHNAILPNSNILSLPSGTYIRLTFTDHGCGIPESDLKNIFDPYFTTKSAGNGLGLASTQSIVSRHGGHIGVNSTVGRGTTFTIHLPALGETYSAYQADSVTQTMGEQRGGSILVMDDEEIIRDMTSEMLHHLGYQVATCENGREAIELYNAAIESGTPFSAVIMDLTIPGGMGGKEAAVQILASNPKACLIVSSGYSNDPIMSDYHSYGFSGAIAKPYKVMEFGQLLSSMVSVDASGNGARTGNSDV